MVNRGVASNNLVTTDFNPLTKKLKRKRTVGSVYINNKPVNTGIENFNGISKLCIMSNLFFVRSNKYVTNLRLSGPCMVFLNGLKSVVIICSEPMALSF